jgi:hypothetical protein
MLHRAAREGRKSTQDRRANAPGRGILDHAAVGHDTTQTPPDRPAATERSTAARSGPTAVITPR